MATHTHQEPRHVRNALLGVLATIALTGSAHFFYGRASQRTPLNMAVVLRTDAPAGPRVPAAEPRPARITDVGARD